MLHLFSSYDEQTGTMDSGYPRSIENDFPGIGDEVDAAAYHYGTCKIVMLHNFRIVSVNVFELRHE